MADHSDNSSSPDLYVPNILVPDVPKESEADAYRNLLRPGISAPIDPREAAARAAARAASAAHLSGGSSTGAAGVGPGVVGSGAVGSGAGARAGAAGSTSYPTDYSTSAYTGIGSNLGASGGQVSAAPATSAAAGEIDYAALGMDYASEHAPTVAPVAPAIPEISDALDAVLGEVPQGPRRVSPAEHSAPDVSLTAHGSNTGRIGPGQFAHHGTEEIDRLLTLMVKMGGSDLHITAGIAPAIRIDGALHQLQDEPLMMPDDAERLVYSILSADQIDRFEKEQELDTAYAIPKVSRFRVNVYRQRGSTGGAFRAIPHRIRSLQELGVPSSVEPFSQLPRGLVLVTGPTGSGKSTTMASLLDVANRTRSGHIVTIEDPIEYLHRHGTCVVNQREVGSDTDSFATALKHVLRQDPDIILIGELRDLETTSTALTAAETGHLVIATLHTKSAAQTIDRLIDIYPQGQQQQIRAQLANALEGVVTQALLPRRDGGRVVVCEVMKTTPAIRSLIREDKVHMIPGYVQAGGDEGMIGFDQHLAERYRDGLVTKHSALEMCQDPEVFRQLAGLK